MIIYRFIFVFNAHTIGFSFRLVFTLCKRYDGGNRGEAITVAASGGFVCFWVGLCASVWVSPLRGGFVSFEVGLNASVWVVRFEVGLSSGKALFEFSAQV